MSPQQLQELPQMNKKTSDSSGSSNVSPKSKDNQYELFIYLAAEIAHTARIWIYNESFRILARPEDGFYETFIRKYLLPSGQYFIRVEINGRIKDTKVNLVSNWNCGIGIQARSIQQQLDLPTLYSSALLRRKNPGSEVHYDSTFEYYTDPAVAISRMVALSLITDHTNSGMFIFLRYTDGNTYQHQFKKKSYWDSFSLVDRSGKTLLNFPEACITDDELFAGNHWLESGFIGVPLHVPPGMYFLKYSGKDARMIPIYVYNNWFTQFFMTVAEEPLFGTIRIFLSSKMEFDPYDRLQFYIDVCLSKLLNNDFTLDKDLLNNVAYRKYDSPMLGLLGAYIYLASDETKDDSLFKLIVENLQEKILKNSDESPDIWALNLLSYKHFNKTLSPTETLFIDGTPTLGIAFDAIRRAAIRYPWLIPEDSLNDHIAENQYFDSAYNTFKPFDKKAFELPSQIPTDNFRSINPSLESALASEAPFTKFSLKNLSTTKVKEFSATKDLSTTAHAIINLLKVRDNMMPIEIAETLNLPVNTVSRIVRQLGII